jgi:hypothetical protein
MSTEVFVVIPYQKDGNTALPHFLELGKVGFDEPETLQDVKM